MTEIAPGLSLVVADCLDALRELDAESVDAICTDPPYGIRFMGKAWDGADIDALALDREEAFLQRGFSGASASVGSRAAAAGTYDLSASANGRFQEWTRAWATEAIRVLKPGGHALVFGGTRTYHRLACGLEDAGFEIRDCLAWMFGSGFPKSLDVAKAIDKAAGVEGGRGEMKLGGERLVSQAPGGVRDGGGTWGDETGRDPYLYVPASDDAKRWQGWGTALKPAFEPIVVARKPLTGTVAANVLAHGVGGLNIDACRIPTEPGASLDGGRVSSVTEGWDRPWKHEPGAVDAARERGAIAVARAEELGRWPANLLLGEEAAELLDEQTGELVSGDANVRRESGADRDGNRSAAYGAESRPAGSEMVSYGDRGGASRFFYVAKVSRAERNAGLDGFDPRPLHWSSGDANPGSFQAEGTDKTARNAHPTVKPVALMRWLIRLVTPPGGLVLDPFAGSGSTGCAAALEGARFLGIERDPGYAEIAEARIRFWAEHGEEALRVVAGREASERAREAAAASGQLDLLGGGE